MSGGLINRGIIILNNQQIESKESSVGTRTIIVTGVARGGTSMLAQVLSQLGLFLGDTCDSVVVEDVEILRALQKSDKTKLKDIVANRNDRFTKWGFKIPNLHNFQPAMAEQQFRSPHYVVVFRDPVAIARRNELSMHQYSTQAIREAGDNVMKLTSYACALTAPTFLVSYEKALQNGKYLIDALDTFCGLAASDLQKAQALAMIEPDGAKYANATSLVYLGQIDRISGTILKGWCCYRDIADVVKIEVFVDGKIIGTYLAGDYRHDLHNAGIHQGFHAFNIDLSEFRITPSSVISVRPAGRTVSIRNSGNSITSLMQ